MFFSYSSQFETKEFNIYKYIYKKVYKNYKTILAVVEKFLLVLCPRRSLKHMAI